MRLYSSRLKLKNYFEFWSAVSGLTYDIIAFKTIDMFAQHTICPDELVIECADLPFPQKDEQVIDRFGNVIEIEEVEVDWICGWTYMICNQKVPEFLKANCTEGV
jgi:hypothetical protein